MRTIIAMVLLLAGCSSILDGHGSGSAQRPNAPAGQIVFQVQPEIGGLAPQTLFRVARPVLTVYGDGTTFTAEVPRSFAAPWAFRRGVIPRATLARLLASADASGLFAGAGYGVPAITDTGTTTVLFRPGGAPASTVSVYALSEDEVDGQLDVVQRSNRIALRGLISRVARSVGPPADWTPTRVEVVAPTPVEHVGSSPAPWPGPDPADLLTRSSWRGPCGELTGTPATRLFAAARRNGTQVWSVGGRTRVLLIRALLPGEPSCPH